MILSRALLALMLTASPAALMAQTTEEAPAPEAPVAREAEKDYDGATVIATVNGEEITLGDVVAVRTELPAQYQALPDVTLYDGLVEQMVDQVLLRQAAERAGYTETPAIQRGLRIQRTSYLAELYIRERLAEQLNQDVIEAEYAKRYITTEKEMEYNAAHILVGTEEEALAIAEEARGGADFAELAKEKSTGPSGPNGGDLGWFGEGMMVPPFQEATFALEVGQISDPVQTQFGWHVIQLKETREKQPPALSAVTEQIVGEMSREITQALVAALRENAEVDIPETQPGLAGLRDDSVIQD